MLHYLYVRRLGIAYALTPLMIKISSNTLSAPLLAARATAVTLPGYSVFNSKKPRKQEKKTETKRCEFVDISTQDKALATLLEDHSNTSPIWTYKQKASRKAGNGALTRTRPVDGAPASLSSV